MGEIWKSRGKFEIIRNSMKEKPNAIIMAAGMSSRFAPLSYEKPKGLLKVKGEVLIERQIRQLQEAGITDITVVVGYMKEQFFYLEDKYGVQIVVNEDYYRYNNTSTLIRALDKIDETYICSSDNYFKPFFNEGAQPLQCSSCNTSKNRHFRYVIQPFWV